MRTLIQRIGLESNRADELAANLTDLIEQGYDNLLVSIPESATIERTQLNLYETKLTDGSIVYDVELV